MQTKDKTYSPSSSNMTDYSFTDSFPWKEELSILLFGVEQVSKHARNMTVVTGTICLYVLLTLSQLKGDWNSELISLPFFVSLKVPAGQFLFFAPIATLISYLFLHTYVSELKKRIFNLFHLISSDSDYHLCSRLVYPWLLTLAIVQWEKNTVVHSNDESLEKTLTTKTLFAKPLSFISIWCLAPATLFALWGKFISREEPLFIVPCITFLFALSVAHKTAPFSFGSISKPLFWVTSFLMFSISLFSFESIRVAVGIESIGGKTSDFLKYLDFPMWLWLIILFFTIQLLPSGIWLTIQLFPLTYRLKFRYWWFTKPHEFWPRQIFIKKWMRFPKEIHDDVLCNTILDGLKLCNRDFSGADFSGSSLRGTNFSDSNLSDSIFKGSNLSNGETFWGLDCRTNLTRVILKRADFTDSTMVSADLTDANAEAATLCNVDLSSAILVRTNLGSAHLSRVNFKRTRFSEVRLEDAVVSGAKNLTNSQIDKSNLSEKTILSHE